MRSLINRGLAAVLHFCPLMFIDPASGTGRILTTNTELRGPGEENDPKLVQRVRAVWKVLGEVR